MVFEVMFRQGKLISKFQWVILVRVWITYLLEMAHGTVVANRLSRRREWVHQRAHLLHSLPRMLFWVSLVASLLTCWFWGGSPCLLWCSRFLFSSLSLSCLSSPIEVMCRDSFFFFLLDDVMSIKVTTLCQV